MPPSSALSQEYPAQPGTYNLTTRHAGSQYTLRIPPQYDGQTALPVILCLHFGGQATDFYGRMFLELIPEPGLGALPAFLVAPTTYSGGWINTDGETAAFAALEEVEEHLCVDIERRVVMGYSLGGMGTWHIASAFRSRFMAAVPIAGAPRQANIDALHDLPLYVIHSREDQVVPIVGDEEAVHKLQARGAPVNFAVLPSGDHFSYGLVIAELHKVAAWLEQLWAGA